MDDDGDVGMVMWAPLTIGDKPSARRTRPFGALVTAERDLLATTLSTCFDVAAYYAGFVYSTDIFLTVGRQVLTNRRSPSRTGGAREGAGRATRAIFAWAC